MLRTSDCEYGDIWGIFAQLCFTKAGIICVLNPGVLKHALIPITSRKQGIETKQKLDVLLI